MDLRVAAAPAADPDALDFIRFCYRRRRVGWPELYDEMWAVAARGLFRGYRTDDLAARGVAFGLFEMRALAALCRTVVADEQAPRRAVAVMVGREDVAESEVAHPLQVTPPVEPAAPSLAPDPLPPLTDPHPGDYRIRDRVTPTRIVRLPSVAARA